MTEPVLCFGDDGSEGADGAWAWVGAQRWPGWRAEVLTALEPQPGPPPSPEDARPHPWDPPHPRYCPDTAVFSEVVHLRADAEPRYVLSGRADASLLVVGPAGGGVLQSLHLGSTTEYLLHHAPVPVVVGRGATPVRRVLVGIDGSGHAERAAEALAALPWCTELDAVVLATVAGEASVGAVSRGRISSLLERAGVAKVVERRVAGAHHADALLDLAREHAVELVVAGTHGASSVKEALLGSTADALVRHATCSVLLARNAGG